MAQGERQDSNHVQNVVEVEQKDRGIYDGSPCQKCGSYGYCYFPHACGRYPKMSTKTKKILTILALLLAMALGLFLVSRAPVAMADPPSYCQITPGVPVWSNPCYAVAPPWNDPNWSPTNGVPGKWGPGGYQPCDKPSGFC